MKVGVALTQAQSTLAASSDSARLDAELLLGAVLGWSRAQLFARTHDELDDGNAQRYAALVQRRRGGEPVAYLTGTQGFWTLDLEVTPSVLVPRPETELLVQWALECGPQHDARVVDLGTGSGAIALALAGERPRWRLTAVDLSDAALAVARRNAGRSGLDVEFVEGSWWAPLAGRRFDLAVANPPYIARHDPHLDALRHEPMLALSDGDDGLQALRAIVDGAAAHLVAGAWLLLEHGYDQGEAVHTLLAAAGFTDIATRRDLEGRERCSGGRAP